MGPDLGRPGDDGERREELDWDADPLPDLIRECIDEDTRGLVFPDAMAVRVIHGSRARRPWSATQGAALVVLALTAGAGVVGAAAVVPALRSEEGRPAVVATATLTRPVPVSRLVEVGYIPRGWRGVAAPDIETPDDAAPSAGQVWTAQYQPIRRGDRPQRVLVRVWRTTEGLDAVREIEERQGARVRPYQVSIGRALLARTAGRADELRIYWQPREGVHVLVRGLGVPDAEVRRVVAGLRTAA
ncbi:hypothetical protein [Thermomonospora amylolytica]|uniref:hypothetical protein n=1 Tax=Thermomonospora amylolytica TaxID=1411117 RepID=UPI000E6C511C|nr:hypothetical protein [Thermomonospora amylolytica]